MRRSLATDVLVGAAAGALATWLMGKVTTALYEREDAGARKREDAARCGKTAFSIAADRGAAALGVRLSDDESKKYGTAIHWTLGISIGALYGALRPRLPAASAGGGLLFGALVWLLMDEGANTALGFTPVPSRFPWQAHARGLVGHLAYGAVSDRVLATVQEMPEPELR